MTEARRPVVSSLELQKRRGEVARLYLQGKPQYEIGQILGVNQSQVCRDLKAIHEEWKERRFADMDQLKADQLAKIDEVEREAWSAWHRSKEDRVVSQAEKHGPGKSEQSRTFMRKESQIGDPRFLERVSWCISERIRIFGLAAPAKVAISDLDTLIEKELQRLASSEGEEPANDLVC